MNKVLETAKFVVDNSRDVRINQSKISDFAENFEYRHVRHWLEKAPFKLGALGFKDRLTFLLLFNSISFSYWGCPKWAISYKGKSFDGAYGMVAALGRAIENNFPLLDSGYLANLSEKEFAKILEANVQIPLFKERFQILRSVGKVLAKTFGGDFTNLVLESKGDSLKLLDLILKSFPPFEDEATYKGRKVYFYKRAQLLIADIFQAFNGQGLGRIKNISELTACADYKLPYVLRRLGILFYSKPLSDKIDNQIQIIEGSEEETEIRANTIWAVEFIKQALKNKVEGIDSIHVNDHLWLLGQNKFKDDKPYHLTRTTSY